MANANPVVQAILAATSNPQVQAAMLLGSRMESGWSPTAVGDGGTSFGPFQIHLPAHPGVTSAEAENPQWAVDYMLPTYTNAVAQVPSSLWSGDPAQAAATAAYYAERPAKMYSASTYQNDWTYVQAALGGTSVAMGGPTNNAAGGTVTTVGSIAGSVGQSIFGGVETDASQLLNKVYLGALIATGGVLIIVGVFLLFRETSAAQAAGKMFDFTNRGSNGDSSSSKPQADTSRTTASKPAASTTPNGSNGAPQRNSNPAATGRRQSRNPVGGTVIARAFTTTAGRPKPPPVKRIPPKAVAS